MKANDLYIQFKIFLGIPLPIKNHFYKGKRLSFRKHWFCKNCKINFDLKPWKSYKDKRLKELVCPICNSEHVFHSTELEKAIIDKKEPEILIKLISDNNKKY